MKLEKSESELLLDAKLSKLFKTFRAIYTFRWAQPVDETDWEVMYENWADAVSVLSDEQLTFAIKKCRVSTGFPPSPGEFLRYAFNFYAENKAYQIASTHHVTELEECKNIGNAWGWDDEVLLKARNKARWVFDDVKTEFSPEKKRNFWNKIYQEEVCSFLEYRIIHEQIQTPS